MTTPNTMSKPEFAVAVRGYDRSQVDEYLARLHEWLTEADARRAAAEDARDAARRELSELHARFTVIEERSGAPTPESMTAFGERLAQMLQEAVEAADELRRRAKQEVEEQRRGFASEGEAMVARARGEAERIIHDARQKERQIGDSIADLARRRADAMGEIGRLHQHLADLLATPQPVPPSEKGDPMAVGAGGRDVVDAEPAPELPSGASDGRAERETPSPTLVQAPTPKVGDGRPTAKQRAVRPVVSRSA